jgi:polysaccharide deacetylase family protein (PEP-CTERM system associated)
VTRHFFTVDVEEHFHVSAFENVVSRDSWDQQPGRLDVTIPRLLELLARHEVAGTFFVLGWVARHRPSVVRAISAAGHGVASHGFLHQRVNTLTPEAFRADIRKSKAAIEDLTGLAVRGYRAPSFSITPGFEWAFDILVEEGFFYDSSVFPIRRSGYGYPGAPRDHYSIVRPAGQLREFPMATARLGGLTVPAAGGGYLRHFPFWIVRRAFQEATDRKKPTTFYIHPWEIDPDQPRLPAGMVTRARHYRGLGRTMRLMTRLLTQFRFTSIESFLADETLGTSTARGVA